jgi:hypothetical protein
MDLFWFDLSGADWLFKGFLDNRLNVFRPIVFKDRLEPRLIDWGDRFVFPAGGGATLMVALSDDVGKVALNDVAIEVALAGVRTFENVVV